MKCFILVYKIYIMYLYVLSMLPWHVRLTVYMRKDYRGASLTKQGMLQLS
jgi:hypothetical protein